MPITNQLENMLMASLILQHKSHPTAEDENSVLRWHRYTSMQMSSRKRRRASCPPCLFLSPAMLVIRTNSFRSHLVLYLIELLGDSDTTLYSVTLMHTEDLSSVKCMYCVSLLLILLLVVDRVVNDHIYIPHLSDNYFYEHIEH